jgi:hypothetical protein
MKTMKIISGLLVVAALILVLPVAVRAQDTKQIKGGRIQLLDPRAGESTTHTFSFTLNSGGAFQELKFEYCTTPSGVCTRPANLETRNATDGTLTSTGGTITDADWSLEYATRGTLRYLHTGAGESLNANTVLTIPFKTVKNHNINDCQAGGDASTDTCYVRISLCSQTNCASQHVIGNGILSYTVVEAVTVTARIDPTFTFVVTGVGADTVNNAITTSVASTFSTLPFSNLTANQPRYAAHKLNVTTNTQAGYTVSMQMQSQMTGVYSVNNIDPFIGNEAIWTSPKTWTSPTGTTPNTDTAWIGANTTDTDVAGWATPTGLFGPVNNAENIVMRSTTSDNGQTAVYVTYGIEANVRQPADTYTGTLVYNALPTY